MDHELRASLREAGATDDEIARAADEGWLPLLALDRVLVPGRPRYDLDGLAAVAGADVATAREVWRALGFADVPAGAAVFTDADADALRLAVGRVGPGVDGARLTRQVRVLSASLARLAAVEAELVAELVETAVASGLGPDETARLVVDELDWPTFSRLVDHVHRVQLRAALWRRLVRDVVGEGFLAVGFSDLAGYTELSERLDASALNRLLTRFEELAYDTVAEHGARVVKTIGDEVMFVGLADQVVGVALDLDERAARDDVLPAVRTGVAAGPLLPRDGDYFGPVVNLASRLTEAAEPGAVLASGSVHDLLAGRDELHWDVRPGASLRGMEPLDVYVVTRATTPAAGEE